MSRRRSEHSEGSNKRAEDRANDGTINVAPNAKTRDRAAAEHERYERRLVTPRHPRRRHRGACCTDECSGEDGEQNGHYSGCRNAPVAPADADDDPERQGIAGDCPDSSDCAAHPMMIGKSTPRLKQFEREPSGDIAELWRRRTSRHRVACIRSIVPGRAVTGSLP